MQWYGHVSHSSGLAKTVMQGTVKGERRQGRQRKRWEDNIREWAGLEFAKSQSAVAVSYTHLTLPTTASWQSTVSSNFLHHNLFFNREGYWGTTDDFTTSFLNFFHCYLGLVELQTCPFPDVVFPPLPLPALSSSPFHCTLQDGFGQAW